jgi:hypothetical protein
MRLLGRSPDRIALIMTPPARLRHSRERGARRRESSGKRIAWGWIPALRFAWRE